MVLISCLKWLIFIVTMKVHKVLFCIIVTFVFHTFILLAPTISIIRAQLVIPSEFLKWQNRRRNLYLFVTIEIGANLVREKMTDIV